jgi:hypothetical protein
MMLPMTFQILPEIAMSYKFSYYMRIQPNGDKHQQLPNQILCENEPASNQLIEQQHKK